MSDSPAAILFNEAGTNAVTVSLDAEDGSYRLEIAGKVSIQAPIPPPAADAVLIVGDTPLTVTSTQDTEYTITNGKTFTLQQVEVGGEGDATTSGSRVDIIFDDDGTERIVERVYILGATVTTLPGTSTSRDGTIMLGASGTRKIIVRRIRLSGGGAEIDAVARGYEQ